MLYLAEFYLPGGTSLTGLVQRARAGASKVASAGTDVRFIRAVFVPRDESCFALYQAASAEAVVAAGAGAGIVFDRVIEALALP